MRRLNIPTTPGDNTYTGGAERIGAQRALALLYLHSDVPESEKKALLYRVIQHGIDIYGAYLAGDRGAAGAGQHHGTLPLLYHAAFALQSRTMIEAAQSIRSNMVNQIYWVDENRVGQSVPWPSRSQANQFYQTYFREHLGTPEWRHSSNLESALLTARYRAVSNQAAILEVLSVGLLKNGPDGETGDMALLAGPDDETNDRAAVIPYFDRLTRWSKSGHLPGWQLEIYGNLRDHIPAPRWTGTPDAPPENHTRVSGIDGGISFEGHFGASTLPVTRVDARVSIDDQKSWRVFEDIDVQDAVEGLTPKLPHYIQFRLVNEKGKGPWSTNMKFDVDSDPYAIATPAGEPEPGAPVNVQIPAIVYRPYPNWQGRYYEPLPESPDHLSSAMLHLYAGVGYWSGWPEPAFSYQWYRDDVPIEGADSEQYRLRLEDAGSILAVKVTAANSEGEQEVFSAGIEMPERLLPEPEPGVILRTDFSNDLDPAVSALISSLSEGGRAVSRVHWFPSLRLVPDASGGCVLGIKSGAWPNIEGFVDLTDHTGKALRVTARMAVDRQSSWESRGTGSWNDPQTARISFALADDDGGADTESIAAEDSVTAESVPLVKEYTGVFSPTPERPWLRIRASNNTSTGGRAMGFPNLVYLRVEEQE